MHIKKENGTQVVPRENAKPGRKNRLSKTRDERRKENQTGEKVRKYKENRKEDAAHESLLSLILSPELADAILDDVTREIKQVV